MKGGFATFFLLSRPPRLEKAGNGRGNFRIGTWTTILFSGVRSAGNKPSRRAVPAPNVAVLQMNAPEPSIDSIQRDVVLAFKDLSSCFCERDFAETVFGRVRYLDGRMPRFGQIGDHPIQRAVSHEDPLLLTRHRDEEMASPERSLFMKNG